MSRFLVACGVMAGLTALPVRCTYEPHAPLTFDLKVARYELGFARPRSELVTVVGSRTELERSLHWARDRCPDCTLLGVGSGVIAVELGPELRARWTDADIKALAGGWTAAFAGTRDVGGSARVLVRMYTNRLSAEGLMRQNPQGVFPPMLWADTKRVQPRIYTSFDWGIGFALAVAAFVIAVSMGRRGRESVEHSTGSSGD